MKTQIVLILSVLAITSAVKFQSHGLEYEQGFHFIHENGSLVVRHFDESGLNIEAQLSTGRKQGHLILPENLEKVRFEEIPFGDASLYELRYNTESINGSRFEHVSVEVFRNNQPVFFRAFPLENKEKQQQEKAIHSSPLSLIQNFRFNKSGRKIIAQWESLVSSNLNLRVVKTCLNQNMLPVEINVITRAVGFGPGKAKLLHMIEVDGNYNGHQCQEHNITIFHNDQELLSKNFHLE